MKEKGKEKSKATLGLINQDTNSFSDKTSLLHHKTKSEISNWSAIEASNLDIEWITANINPYHTYINNFNFGNSKFADKYI